VTDSKYDLRTTLAHYGILGMHWGIRRTNPSGGNVRDISGDSQSAKVALSKARKHGIESLTNAELKAATERINFEENFKTARAKSSKRAAVGRFAKELLLDIGKQEFRKAVAAEGAKQVGKLLLKR